MSNLVCSDHFTTKFLASDAAFSGEWEAFPVPKRQSFPIPAGPFSPPAGPQSTPEPRQSRSPFPTRAPDRAERSVTGRADTPPGHPDPSVPDLTRAQLTTRGVV